MTRPDEGTTRRDRKPTGQRSHKGPALLSKLLGRDDSEPTDERERLRTMVESNDE